MLNNYIKENWKNTIRFTQEDRGTLIGLPYPYSVPGMGDEFPEMYYWDTYFTNKGLLLSNMEEQARNNVNNLLYLVNKYGYVPNGNRTFYLTRSQPPFLSFMVRDIYEVYKDKEWLLYAYVSLKLEYNFWMGKRMTKIGLNQYAGAINTLKAKKHADRYRNRTGLLMEHFDDEALWQHYIAFCESGWDINPRWDFNSYQFVQPELNSLLFMMENNMTYFSKELELEEDAIWEEHARNRKRRMNEYLVDENQIFRDYNFKIHKLGRIYSAASYYPLFTGVATKQQALAAADMLKLFETEYGIVTTLENETKGSYQWDYPNGWPPIHYIVIKGLLNYGFQEDAVRIAKKYMLLVDKVFQNTNQLWEKYNVVKGNIEVTNEYKMPPMMGWTAGVYLLCHELVYQQ